MVTGMDVICMQGDPSVTLSFPHLPLLVPVFCISFSSGCILVLRPTVLLLHGFLDFIIEKHNDRFWVYVPQDVPGISGRRLSSSCYSLKLTQTGKLTNRSDASIMILEGSGGVKGEMWKGQVLHRGEGSVLGCRPTSPCVLTRQKVMQEGYFQNKDSTV